MLNSNQLSSILIDTRISTSFFLCEWIYMCAVRVDYSILWF